jgi:hypothetical protein
MQGVVKNYHIYLVPFRPGLESQFGCPLTPRSMRWPRVSLQLRSETSPFIDSAAVVNISPSKDLAWSEMMC